MPLTFESLNHGRVAFGFFNIESDMLLLEHYFFFATKFCDLVNDLAHTNPEAEFKTSWSVFNIEHRSNIGDLMGAIRGEHHLGFLGDTYLKYPFPRKHEDFKQNPTGSSKQVEFAEMKAHVEASENWLLEDIRWDQNHVRLDHF